MYIELLACDINRPPPRSVKPALFCAFILGAFVSTLFGAKTYGGDQPRLRLGLKNSAGQKALRPKELEILIKDLREKTGFLELGFDQEGFLILGDRSRFSGGAAAARELLIATVEMKDLITLESHPRSINVLFARLADHACHKSLLTGAIYCESVIRLDFNDFTKLRGDKQALAAFDPGFILIHELGHAVLDLQDATGESPGECEAMVNRIRRELRLPERQAYVAQVYTVSSNASHRMIKRTELLFKRIDVAAK